MQHSTTVDYDAIVVGLGAFGSAAASTLARRGRRVLGLDAHGVGHTLGSSHGESRIIRLAYYEHPDYVVLLRRAYDLWEQLEQESGARLLRLTGGLFAGPPDGDLVAGSQRSARQHGLPHEMLDAAEIRRRFPALRPAEHEVALYEARAGILFPERCIETQLRLAAAAGATLRHEEPVRRWRADGSGVVVQTDQGQYRAARLVLAAGAWLGALLPDIGVPLRPERNVVFWLRPRATPELFEPQRLPIYIWDTGAAGNYYGFPHLERPGVKVARHHSGQFYDPQAVPRAVAPEDEAPVRAFVRSRIPALDGPVADGVVCLYTNSPDTHFLVDRHPEHPQVVFAGGCSGHGFKFAPLLGEVLADLATEGRATPAVDFLRATRPGLRSQGPESTRV